MDEFIKSLKATLYERAVSPLWGVLILTWCLYNWEILVTVLVTSEKIIGKAKVEYIKEHYINVYDNFYGPIISTLLILTLGQVLSNVFYWSSLQFKKSRVNTKRKIDEKTLITTEQYVDYIASKAALEQKYQRDFQKYEAEKSKLENEFGVYKTTHRNTNGEFDLLKNMNEEQSEKINDLRMKVSSYSILKNGDTAADVKLFFERLCSNSQFKQSFLEIHTRLSAGPLYDIDSISESGKLVLEILELYKVVVTIDHKYHPNFLLYDIYEAITKEN